jgi:hypothetical protein
LTGQLDQLIDTPANKAFILFFVCLRIQRVLSPDY